MMNSLNAVDAISRIVEMLAEEHLRLRLGMLADKLTGVIAQKLLPNKRDHARVLAYKIRRNNTSAVADAIRNNDR